MRVLVTGATGFIGQQVCRTLGGTEHDIWATSSEGTTRESRETLSLPIHRYTMGGHLPVDLIGWKPEVVLHLAWEGIPDLGPDMCAKNVRDQRRFFEQVCDLPSVKKVVTAGSCREYGDVRGPCQESLTAETIDVFGSAKEEIRRSLETSCAGSGIDVTWLRIFYVYGPGQRPGGLIPSLVDSLVRGEQVHLGFPDAAHDFVHVDDVAHAFVCALEQPDTAGIFNVGSGRPTVVADVARLVTAAWSGDGSVDDLGTIPTVTTADTGMWADLTQIKKCLDWRPKVDLATGIATTTQWFAKRLEQDRIIGSDL